MDSEDFPNPNMHQFVHETATDQELDFVTLLETGRPDFSVPFLKHHALGFDFEVFCGTLK
jgi:hypothetical protein